MKPIDEAIALREEGMARAAGANKEWLARAINTIRPVLRPGSEVMGEDIRFYLTGAMEAPSSDKVWGPLIRSLILKGVIRPTGRYSHPCDPKSHACMKPVYVVA